MHIIFITDCHGKFDKLSALPQGDALLIGGDFTTLGNAKTFSDAIQTVEKVAPHFYGIGGNMDLPTAASLLGPHLIPLDSPLTLGHLKLRGWGGCNQTPFNSPCEWNEEEMESRFNTLPDDTDLFILHAPPFESGADRITSGLAVGSKAIASLINRLQPALVCCGHIHEARGIFSMGKTLVVNPGAFSDGHFAHIEWNAGEAPSVWLDQL